MAGIFSSGFRPVGNQMSMAIFVPSLMVTYRLWRSATRRDERLRPPIMQANNAINSVIHKIFERLFLFIQVLLLP